MAFPVLEDADTAETASAAAGTSHTVTLPANISSGNGLLVFVGSDSGGIVTVGWPAGWDELYDTSNNFECTGAAAYRDADGTEGASITVTTSASEHISAVAVRFTGVDFGTDPPEANTSTGSGNTDPPALTPTGGAKEYQWVAVSHQDRNRVVSSYPANYTSNQHDVQSGGGSLGVSTAIATRDVNAASENPGAYTITSADGYVGATVAVFPAAAAPAGGASRYSVHRGKGLRYSKGVRDHSFKTGKAGVSIDSEDIE